MPKVTAFPDDNEDSVAVAADNSRIAVSDGASESFDSRRWSRLLASAFVENGNADRAWVSQTVARYEAILRPFLDNASGLAIRAAVERGSYASLLGLERLPDNHGVRVYAIGDSVAVLLLRNERGDVTRIASVPYRDSRDFRRRPELISTNQKHNHFTHAMDFPASHECCWLQRQRDTIEILCMTDALAEWAFRQEEDGEPAWDVLLNMRTTGQYEQLVFAARESRKMHVDDTTLVVVRCSFAFDFTEL